MTRTDVAQAEARRAGSIANLEVARGNLKASRATYERVVGSPAEVDDKLRHLLQRLG